MKSTLVVLAVGLLGLFGATSIGYAAYVVSRDSVGLPVTKLKLSPNKLAPVRAKRTPARPKPKATSTATSTRTSPQTTSTDDHGGDSSNSGKGSNNSGHGGGDDGNDD
jgi:hypothetical protein